MKTNLIDYLSPDVTEIDLVLEECILSNSPLKPGESEDGILGDDL